VLTLGVDLAAADERTALAVVEWRAGSAAIRRLRAGDHEKLMRESHDAFDAVIAALGTRAVALGQFRRPTAAERPIAEVEGWIALPACDLADLVESYDETRNLRS
jgi:hypothetical protein